MTINRYRTNRYSTTTSKYFNHVNSKPEQDLYNALTVESIKISGIDIWYIPRSVLEIDPILGEPTRSTFESAYQIECNLGDVTGFGGGDEMTAFGLSSPDEVELIVSQERWRSLNIPGMEFNRPREGDLIYMGTDSAQFSINYFEITKVDYDKFFFQFGKTFVYSMKCVAYTGAYEPITTGIPEIDDIGYDNSSELNLGTNAAVKEKETILRVFDEKNPFDF